MAMQRNFSHAEVCMCACHFIHPPESRRLARSVEGGGGRLSGGSCLIDVFRGVEEGGGGRVVCEDEEGMGA